jgi:hypothetical protein
MTDLPMKRKLRSMLGKALRQAHRASRRAPLPHRPDLSDMALYRRLDASSEMGARVMAAVDRGDAAAARHAVLHHFTTRTAPAFFCDVGEVSDLADTIRRIHPDWVHALCRRVDEDMHLGLRIMSRRAAPLAGGFSWAGLAAGPGGDTLFSAQPHRCGFMPRLAIAALHGKPTLPVIVSLLQQWISVTEASEPESYHSPLVVLYRVLALSWTFAFVAGLRNADECPQQAALFAMLKILSADIAYLTTKVGHSYPNNHLLADGLAGWYCGLLYPELSGAQALKAEGEALFVRELQRQFLADGTSFEHSTHYHELGCEMTSAYVLLSRRNGLGVAPDVLDLLEKMLGFQASLTGAEAIALPVGDSTEDPLFPLDAMHGWAAGALRELHRALFDDRVTPAPAQDVTVERAFWLLGGRLAPSRPPSTGTLPATFELGGFFVQHDAERRARLMFRSGPAEGQLISAGHAHSDLLSLYLSVDGVPFIVSAGTYTYRFNSKGWPAGSPPWRRYFAGPYCQNGPASEDDPFGEMTGDFRNRDVPCRISTRQHIAAPALTWLEFEIAGENPMAGYRRGLVHVVGEYWVVYDLPTQACRKGGLSMGLQFAPGTRVSMAHERHLLAHIESSSVSVALSTGFTEARIFSGSMEPLAGWVSPRYGEVVQAPQLRAGLGTNDAPCAFLLQPMCADDGERRINATHAGPEFIALQISGRGAVDTLLISTSGDGQPFAAFDVRAVGGLVWLRTVQGKVADLRSVHASRCSYRGHALESSSLNPSGG